MINLLYSYELLKFSVHVRKEAYNDAIKKNWLSNL